MTILLCIAETVGVFKGMFDGLRYADEHGYLDWTNPVNW